jgi:hypothetical protein
MTPCSSIYHTTQIAIPQDTTPKHPRSQAYELPDLPKQKFIPTLAERAANLLTPIIDILPLI